MSARRSDTRYARIANAELDREMLIITFANGDVVELPAETAFGQTLDAADWDTLHWDMDCIFLETGAGIAELPWDEIRTLTDPDFASQMAAAAEEHAGRIGSRLRALRESRGLSSKQVAERAGITPQSMSRIELGRHDVVFTTLERILAAMGYRLRDLAVADALAATGTDGGDDSGFGGGSKKRTHVSVQTDGRETGNGASATAVPSRKPSTASGAPQSRRPRVDAESRALARLDDLTDSDFRSAMGRLLESHGYANVQRTPDAGDFGADLLGVKDDTLYAIQTKCALSHIGANAVRHLMGGMAYWSARRGLVLTNSFFTDAAYELARDRNVVLVDRSELKRWLAEARPSSVDQGITPLPHQTQALDKLSSLRDHGEDRALVVMAAGLGKTYVAALDACRFQEECGRPVRVLYLSHQAVILRQARRAFERVFGTTRTYGYFEGSRRESDRDLLFATFQSLYRAIDDLDPQRFDYVIVDEAHHTAALTRDAVVSHLAPDFLLGLTATPFRGDGRDISAYYGDVLAASVPLEQALADGLLAPIDYRVLSDQVDSHALERALQLGNGNGASNGHLFEPVPDTMIVDTVMSEASKVDGIHKILVFCASLAQMDRFAEVFPRSRTISGRDNRAQQIATVEDLRAGAFEVLLSRDVLNEGIDIPHATTLVFLRNTESQVVFLQQLGRGLRRIEGKDRVDVFDFVNTLPRIEFVYRFFSRLESAQSARRARRGTSSGTESSLSLDPTARDVVTALLRRKRASGNIADLSSLGEALSPKISPATLRRIVETGRLVPDFVMPSSQSRNAMLFERATVDRFMRQVRSPLYAAGLLRDHDLARQIGQPVAWIREQQRRGRLPAAWVHQRSSNAVDFYYEPDDVHSLSEPPVG